MKENPFAVYDIEANNWIDFEVLGLFDGEQYNTFTSPKKFLSFIDQKAYKGFTFFAHNAGKYDILFLLEDMFSLGLNPSILERGGRVILVECNFPKAGKIRFCDSYALLPASQAKLAKSFGVEHDKIEFDFEHNRVSRSDKLLMKRLENDCKGMFEIITKFYGSSFIENPRITIASQAMDTFKNKFLKGKLQETNIEYEDIFREYFYAGGRVEVFKGYGQGVNVYDVNSLYPSVMLNEMPTGECIETNTFQKDKIGFYEVELQTAPNFYIPPFLIKGKKNLYVNGRGTYFCSSAMLEYLKRVFGVRFKVNYGFYFRGRDYLFNDYVNYFYPMKQEARASGDSAMEYISKLFLNSLYGKFAQKREHEKIVKYAGQKDFVDFESDIADHLGLVIVKERSRSWFVLPYLAAYITELARLHHFKLMMEVEKNIFYCDTDSIFTDKKFQIGNGIGELSFQGQFDGVFLQSKTYALKNDGNKIVKFKGFDSKQFTFTKFMNVLKHGNVLTQKKTRILGFREAMRRTNNILHKSGAFLILVEQIKQASNRYDKRKVIPSEKYIFNTRAFDYSEVQTTNDNPLS